MNVVNVNVNVTYGMDGWMDAQYELIYIGISDIRRLHSRGFFAETTHLGV